MILKATSLFFQNIDIFGYLGKERHFQSDLKIIYFPPNVVIFGHMIVFWYVWQKKLFLQYDVMKSTFFLNIDIFEDMGKQTIFLNDLKKTSFSLKCWYFRRNVQKTFLKCDLKSNVLFVKIWIFSNIWANNDIFKVISK